MLSRKWLFALILIVPLIGFGVAEGIQAHFNSQLRSALRQSYPEVADWELATFTVSLLCQDAPQEFRDLCGTYANLKTMSRAALSAGAVGLLLLLFIRVAGALAKNSRHLLVLLFRPGLYLTVLVLIGLVVVHAAIAMAAIYYGEAILVGRIHVGIIAAIGFGAIVGVWAMISSSFTLIRNAQTFVIGKKLSRDQAPLLWGHVDKIANSLGALEPNHIVLGLDPNFFVTEADVICFDGILSGRTLYCSMPLCRILTRREFSSIVGHELGHFRGEDTRYSKRFYPIYRGTTSSLEALETAGGEGAGSVALLPAIAVLSYFLESFAVAESRLSRSREVAADQAASSITNARTTATALVKLHAFADIWAGLQEIAINALCEGKMFPNASTAFAEVVSEHAVPEVLKGIHDAPLTHPTDSHPPLSVRLESLELSLSDVAAEALEVSPADSAITLLSEPRALEEEISAAYQMILAQKLGIGFGEAEGALPGEA